MLHELRAAHTQESLNDWWSFLQQLHSDYKAHLNSEEEWNSHLCRFFSGYSLKQQVVGSACLSI